MSQLYEAGQALARHLVVEHAYVPLEQLLSGTEGIAQALDGALACFEGPDLRVHAWVLDEDNPHPDLQAEGLRHALQAQEPRIPGRIKATVWVLALTRERAQAVQEKFLKFEDGHFLSKTLVGRGVLCVEDLQGSNSGRLAPRPGAPQLARYLDAQSAPNEAQAKRLVMIKQADERQSRRLLRGSAVPVTWVLIGLNAGVYLLQELLQRRLQGQGLSADQAWTVVLQVMGANDHALTFGQGQLWRLLAACFLHAGVAHIALNMMSLYSLGGIFERLAGPWRFLGLYLAAGLGASLLSASFGKAGIPSVGASGAILGLAGALLAPRWKRDPRFPKDLSDRLFSWLARPLGFLFAIGFTLQLMDLPFQLDNFAHLGGLLTGFAVAYIHPPFLIRKTDRKV